jgi:hypothetical protein
VEPVGNRIGAWDRTVDVLAREPQLLLSAVRASLLAAVSFGLGWSPEAIGAVMIALEAWLALASRVMSVPRRAVDGQVKAAVAVERAEITDYLHAAEQAKARPLRVPRLAGG